MLNVRPLIFHSNLTACPEISVFLQYRTSINISFFSSSITNYPRRLTNDLNGREIHELHTREKSGSKNSIATGGQEHYLEESAGFTNQHILQNELRGFPITIESKLTIGFPLFEDARTAERNMRLQVVRYLFCAIWC
jgi:hypothetical protein